MYKWSTDQVEPQHRFDHWREVRARGLFGVTAELEPEQRPQFQGEFSLRKIGTASLIELRASPYHVERTAADIAHAPGASLCIYQQLGGGGWFGLHGSDEFALRQGGFATSHTDLPYRTVPLADDGFHLRILKVPAAGLITPHADLHNLFPKPFCSQPSLTPLLESCFLDLTEADDGGDPAMSAPLVAALAQLALIERGLVRPASRAAMGAIRIGHLSLALRLITRHLSNAALSPAFVAGLLGISVRHLYALFEASGMSFAQTVTAQRIGESRRLLKEAPARSISQIAFACGFESLATFYRAFQAAHGAAPGDFRAQGKLQGNS